MRYLLLCTLFLVPCIAMAEGEPLGLAEEGSAEASKLKETSQAEVKDALESPAEAAEHQKALDRETGKATTTAEAATTADTTAETTTTPTETPSTTTSDTTGLDAPDLAVDSEPAWLSGKKIPPPRAAKAIRKASKPKLEVALDEENGRISTPPFIFKPWSTTLSDSDQAVLLEVANIMKENPEGVPLLEIEAYTDDSGDPALNESLSVARANVIKACLIKHGIGVHRLVAKGMGDVNPIATNDTAEGRKQNRRVEFKIVK